MLRQSYRLKKRFKFFLVSCYKDKSFYSSFFFKKLIKHTSKKGLYFKVENKLSFISIMLKYKLLKMRNYRLKVNIRPPQGLYTNAYRKLECDMFFYNNPVFQQQSRLVKNLIFFNFFNTTSVIKKISTVFNRKTPKGIIINKGINKKLGLLVYFKVNPWQFFNYRNHAKKLINSKRKRSKHGNYNYKNTKPTTKKSLYTTYRSKK